MSFLKSFGSFGKSQTRENNGAQTDQQQHNVPSYNSQGNQSHMTKPPRSKNQSNTVITNDADPFNSNGGIDDKKKFLSYFSNKMKGKNGEEVNSRNGASGNFFNANSAYADAAQPKQEFLGVDALTPNRNAYKTNANLGSNRIQVNNYKIPSNYNSSNRASGKQKSELEQYKQEIEQLKEIVQEQKEENQQLANNLKINKDIIQSLANKNHRNYEEAMETIELEESFNESQEVAQDNNNNGGGANPTAASVTSPIPKFAIPSLNLSSLKHVKEYTTQTVTTLEQPQLIAMKQAETQKKSNPTQRPGQRTHDKDNQWYHYSTKLELNTKQLRTEIEQLEQKLDVSQQQIAKDKKVKFKLKEQNAEMKQIIKDQREKLNAQQLDMQKKQKMVVDLKQAYQTYDGRQNNNIQPPVQHHPNNDNGQIQIQNLKNLYQSNSFYIEGKPQENIDAQHKAKIFQSFQQQNGNSPAIQLQATINEKFPKRISEPTMKQATPDAHEELGGFEDDPRSQSIEISEMQHHPMGSNDFSAMLYSTNQPVNEIDQDKDQNEDQESNPITNQVISSSGLDQYVHKKVRSSNTSQQQQMIKLKPNMVLFSQQQQ